ncbi:MAG: type II toxin-antitoxin system antitoxin VapB [Desulfobulbia bacterium]|jgi:antitoxin VapB
MNTAKIFKSGNSQAVRLPKGFQLEGNEVYIKRVGKNIILTSKDDPWAGLIDSLDMFSDDFMAERLQPPSDQREEF